MTTTYTIKNNSDVYLQSQEPRFVPVSLPNNVLQGSNLKYITTTQDGLMFNVNEENASDLEFVTIRGERHGSIEGDFVFTVTDGTATLTTTGDPDEVRLYYSDMESNFVEITLTIEDIATVKQNPSDPNNIYETKIKVFKIFDGLTTQAASLSVTDQTIEYNTEGLIPNPSTYTVTCNVFNDDGLTLYYEFIKNNTTTVNTTTNNYTYSAEADIENMPHKIDVVVRRDTIDGPVVAKDTITVFGLKQGANAYTIILSNETHAVPCDSDGTISTLNGSGTEIEVWYGTTKLTYDDVLPYSNTSYRVSAVGSSGVVPDSSPYTVRGTRVYSNLESLTSDAGSVTYTINAVAPDGTTFTGTKKQTLFKSRAGSIGKDSRTIVLTSPTQVVSYDEAGVNPSPSTAFTITATALNTVETPYYEFKVDGVTQQNTTSNTYSYTPKVSYTSMPDLIQVNLREGSSSGTILASDSYSIIGVKKNSDAIQVVLSNETHSVPCDQFGTPVSFVGSGTTITVYQGSAKLVYDTTSPYQNGSYRFGTITVSGITSDTTPFVVSNVASFNGLTSFSANSGYLDFEVIITGKDGTESTIVKRQTFSKSLAGQDGSNGVNGRTVSLVVNDQTIEYDEAGTSPSPSSVTFTATANNTEGTVYYGFYVNGSSTASQNTTSNTFVYSSPSSVTNTPINVQVKIRENSNSSTVLAADSIGVGGLKKGSDGLSILLSNSAHSLPKSSTGVIDYTGSGTNIEVWQGTNKLAYTTSRINGSWYVSSVNDVNITVGSASTSSDTRVYGNSSNMTSTSAYIDFTLQIKGVNGVSRSVVARQSLSQSVQGLTGADGADGAIGPRRAEIYFYNINPSASAPTSSALYFDYNFDTNTPSVTSTGQSYGWRTSFSPAAISDDNTGNNKYWAVRCNFAESSFGSGDATPNVIGPYSWLNFDGLVTFTNLANGTNIDGTSSTTLIDGGSIKTGTVTASQINANGLSIRDPSGNIILNAGSTPSMSKSVVGLGNVSNLSPASMTDSGLTTGVTISSGGITMSGGGAIKTVLKDGILDTSEGVFLGYDSSLGGYGFAVGNSSDYVRYNPSTNTLEVRGVLNADDIVAGSLNASYIGTGVVSLADGAFGLGQGASWQGVDLQIYGESTINGQYGMGSINTSTTGYDAHGFVALAASAASYGATIYNATGSGGTIRAYGFIAGAGNGGVFGRNWDGLNSNRTKVFVGTYGAAGLFTFNENTSDVHAPYAAFICGNPYAVAGQYRNSSTGVPITDGRLGGTTYAVYAQTGNMAPFTGSHDGLLDKTSNAVAGDILVDVFVYATRGVNDAICVNEVSSVANQKAVIGVLSMKAPEQHIPTVLSDDGFEYTNNSEEPTPCSTVKPEYANYTDYDVIVINSVGEGLINVCGEGGDIEIGDLIVTSSIAGKGMKQSDDIVRNITVAKSRENVTFTSPDEIKQIACIYMCG